MLITVNSGEEKRSVSVVYHYAVAFTKYCVLQKLPLTWIKANLKPFIVLSLIIDARKNNKACIEDLIQITIIVIARPCSAVN